MQRETTGVTEEDLKAIPTSTGGNQEPFEDDKEWFLSQDRGQSDGRLTRWAIALIIIAVFICILGVTALPVFICYMAKRRG